jgi:hypothetical protein
LQEKRQFEGLLRGRATPQRGHGTDVHVRAVEMIGFTLKVQ